MAGSEYQTANAAKAIDANFDAHLIFLRIMNFELTLLSCPVCKALKQMEKSFFRLCAL
jgi:hypothetical protein